MRSINRLTTTKVAATTKPGLYADGMNLYLQVAKGGSKSWVFRYMLAGRPRKMGLGSANTLTLKAARERAQDCRIKLLDADDPIELRKAAKLAKLGDAASAITFEEAATRYIAAHEAGWRSRTHAAQWSATLKEYAFPVFGKLAVSRIDTGLVLRALEPIWHDRTETASRVRGRIESVLDWSTARKYRTGENPARWRGHLQMLLPARNKIAKVQHHPALPYTQAGELMERLRGVEGVPARALEFAILTATRTGEIAGARWSEIDLENAMWIIPGDRMKAGKDHRVPLSERALAILRALPRERSEYVFIGMPGRPLSKGVMLKVLRRLGGEDLTVHGFRSCFRDWASEMTAYPSEAVEMALAHTVADKVEAAYRRGDLLDKRRRLMADWAAYCAAPAATSGKVVGIRRPAHA